jgi:hypothetical protein
MTTKQIIGFSLLGLILIAWFILMSFIFGFKTMLIGVCFAILVIGLCYLIGWLIAPAK